jgi:hypothetical protein
MADKPIMKRLNIPNSLFLLIALLLVSVGCMPDSLTKYEEQEASTKKKQAGKSSGSGSSPGTSIPSGCIPNTFDGGGCTAITALDYTGITSSALHISLDSDNVGQAITAQSPTIAPATSDGINYIQFSVAPALPNNLSLNPNTGVISGVPQAYSPKTTYTITATHLPTNTTAVKNIEIGIATDLDALKYHEQVGSTVILRVTDVIGPDPTNPKFSAIVPPANTVNLVNESGAQGIIRYVDKTHNELHVEIAATSTGFFSKSDNLDNDSTFFSGVDTIQTAWRALDRAVGFIGGSITPVLTAAPGRTFTAPELASMQYSISPPLPTGMTLNTTTGQISGTATSNTQAVAYVVTVKNILDQTTTTKTASFSILDVAAPKTIEEVHYNQSASDFIALEVDDVTKFAAKTTIEGTVAVTAGSTNVTGTNTRFQSELLAGGTIVIGNEFHTIASITNDTALVLAANHEAGTSGTKATPVSWYISALDDNGTPTDPSDDSTASGHIRSADSNAKELTVEVISGQFKPNMTLSSGPTYLTTADTIKSVQYIFSSSQSPTMSPTLAPHHAVNDAADIASVRYTITPNIPPETGLSFNTTTGVISGTAPLSSFEGTFTVRATSLNGRFKDKQVKLFVQPTLSRMSITNQVLLTVDSTAKFLKGDLVSSPGEDNKGSAKGIVYEIIDSTKLLIQVTSGRFMANTGLDNLKDYNSEKARILTIKNNSAILTVAGAPTAGSIITSSGGAEGVVNYSTASKVYVRTTSGSWTTDHTIGGNAITNIWATNMKFSMNGGGATSTDFFIGSDVVTARCYSTAGTDVTAVAASDTKAECEALYGTCYNADESINMSLPPTNLTSRALCDPDNTTRIWKSDAWRAGVAVVNETEDTDSDGDIDNLYVSYESGDFKETDPLDNQNPFDCTPSCPAGGEQNVGATQLQINGTNGISTDTFFTIKAGVLTSLEPSFATGDDSAKKFAVIPDLPEGLSLNATTGVISGTATELLSKTKYTLVATNKLGSISYDFHLKVHSTFGVLDSSSKSVYAFHKLGHGRKLSSKCEITQDQIDAALLSGDNRTRDITCILEAGEKDLHSIGASLRFNVSPGICNHVTHVPFQFYDRAPHRTNGGTFTRNTGNVTEATCIAAYGGAIPEYEPYEPKCLGNYDLGTEVVRCDEGRFFQRERVWVFDAAAGTCTPTLSEAIETECGGDARECIEGPVRDIGINHLSSVGVTVQSIEGHTPDTPFNYTSPNDAGHGSNLRLANFMKNNSCAGNDYVYQTTNWDNYSDISRISDPFHAGNPFYTFHCLDDSQEIIARINVLIREWDQDFNVDDSIDQLDPGKKLDAGATTTDSFGALINNRSDWDDQNVDLANCGVGTPTFAASSFESFGNATVVNGSNVVTGTGFSGNIKSGDRVVIDRGGAQDQDLIVSSVLSNTTLTTTTTVTSISGTYTFEAHRGTIATITGTASVPLGSTTVTGVGTSFTTELRVGDRIVFERGSADQEILVIAEIIDADTLVLGTAAAIDHSGAAAIEVVEVPKFPALR